MLTFNQRQPGCFVATDAEKEHFNGQDDPGRLRSVPIMRMLLAWRVQAETYGGLDFETRRLIARTGRVRAEGLELGIGARLTRIWQGREVEVVIEPEGFRWNDTIYPSLSAAATAIAGSRWNGPRFFGLRKAA